MKPLDRNKANFSSEPLQSQLESSMDETPAAERVDIAFYQSYADICERALADGREEDIVAIQAIENCYHERRTITFDILVELFGAGVVSNDKLARAKQLLPEHEYRSLMGVLENYVEQSKENDAAMPLSSETQLCF